MYEYSYNDALVFTISQVRHDASDELLIVASDGRAAWRWAVNSGVRLLPSVPLVLRRGDLR